MSSHVGATEVREAKARHDLSGRVAIITGAGQGIGRAFALAYAAAGAISVIAEINEVSAQSVVTEIEAFNGRAMAVPTDISDQDSLGEMARAVIAKLGRIDILVNNAAIFSTLKMRPFEDIPLDEWRRVMDVNITGVMLTCRAV